MRGRIEKRANYLPPDFSQHWSLRRESIKKRGHGEKGIAFENWSCLAGLADYVMAKYKATIPKRARDAGCNVGNPGRCLKSGPCRRKSRTLHRQVPWEVACTWCGDDFLWRVLLCSVLSTCTPYFWYTSPMQSAIIYTLNCARTETRTLYYRGAGLARDTYKPSCTETQRQPAETRLKRR